MNKPHKHAELIIAWANGAEIEWYNELHREWLDIKNPTWNRDREYRVKPKFKWTPRYRRNTAYEDGICIDVTVPKVVCDYYTIQQFVDEHETDFDDQNFMIFKEDEGVYDYVLNTYESLGTIEMSSQCAEKLCKMLNNGEIEL